MGSYYKYEGSVCAKKRESIPVYLLLREERGEVCEFIDELRKRYIRPSKSPQIALVFFVERKDSKNHMI